MKFKFKIDSYTNNLLCRIIKKYNLIIRGLDSLATAYKHSLSTHNFDIFELQETDLQELAIKKR